MARFGFTTSNYLKNASASLTATPVSMACWFYYMASPGVEQTFVDLHASGSATNRNCFELGFSAAGGNAVSCRTGSPTSSTQTLSASIGFGAWHHAAAVFASATSRQAYADGIGGTVSTTSRVPSGIDQETIGCMRGSGTAQACTAHLADVAIWNIDLTSEEIKKLSQGESPLNIRPVNLVRYFPLENGFYYEPNLGGDISAGRMEVVGTLPWVANNPYPILPTPIFPRRLFNLIPQVAAAAVTRSYAFAAGDD